MRHTEIQSVLISKDKFSFIEAKNWLKEHKFKYIKLDETGRFCRFRQFDPIKGKKYRNKKVANGIELVTMIK